MQSCKNCNSHICKKYQTDKRKNKDINFYFSQKATLIKRKCKETNIPYAFDIKQILLSAWEKQKGKCYYTGELLKLTGYHAGESLALTVDRIEPNLGYVDGNIVLASSIANRSKQDMSIEEYRNFCSAMVKHLDRIIALRRN